MKDNLPDTDMGGMAEFMAAINKNKNPRDAVFSTMADNIWKPEMKTQMHRFSLSQVIDIIKNFIVMLNFTKNWSQYRITHTIKKTPDYPYYKIIPKLDKKIVDIGEFLKKSEHALIIGYITDLFIGLDGKAREEVFGFINSYAKAVEEQRMMSSQNNPLQR